MSHLHETAFYPFFEEISAIPRGSGDEERISQYLVDFACQRDLDHHRDQWNNVVICKPGTGEKTCAKPVILQAHMDMVCEKQADVSHDFTEDPIELVERDGFLWAGGTTLGADNGIGMAYILAVLADPGLAHPPIEAVFTTGEEVGMKGIAGLDASVLKATRMINLDADEEGTFYTSCAGGARFQLDLPIATIPVTSACVPYHLRVTGLEGGHSGLDIHRGRGNAILLLARVLYRLCCIFQVQLQRIDGGGKTNAIPRQATATLWIPKENVDAVQRETATLEAILLEEHGPKDPSIHLELAAADKSPAMAMAPVSQQRVLAALSLLPNGVVSYSPYLEDMVDSSCNVGTAETKGDWVHLGGLARANTDSRLDETVCCLECLAHTLSGVLTLHSRYPAWAYRPESELRPLCDRVYQKMLGSAARLAGIHAGLECALMAEKRPDLDMVAFGPNLLDAHTPTERVKIASVLRTWDYLCALLEALL